MYHLHRSMPVIERGVGLDRAVYKLPVRFLHFYGDIIVAERCCIMFILVIFVYDLVVIRCWLLTTLLI